jgi:DNA (cytosine-5)-methyltransferase 3A
MKVLSLFDGMSCGLMALRKLKVNVAAYYASEIDSYAIKNSSHNFPEIIQLGDVQKWRDWAIPWEDIDLILAGSPCQGFSRLGKHKGLKDNRSALVEVFFDIVSYALRMNKGVHFLLENVKMDKTTESYISSRLNVTPITINSSLVSAQNRVRLYWTNINDGDIPQPADKRLYMKDIVEKNVENRFFLSEYTTGKIITEYPTSAATLMDKSKCVTTGVGRNIGSRGSYVVERGGIRRFTVREAARLQTIPDDYAFVVSERESYKMIGNGWTIDVIAHILSFMS